ncbi:hypothetical protein F441_09407 [Phytophthora nicotianae CJ01A1]|uniref:BZIP domain-containing protein n=5 Tax=Phytophthora nicotianae TaxID=4792 RepID=W2Q7S3_PHYN3|nr:hypothetical protein PPTG_12370 [Phytophthora nicotianae INRA-310]ETK86076.1 hypothetical protein L915_09268 [Phytophthora nicotianae]ETO74811.1 hypothetical protein F444_09532 [Phytophthora nicotianae P1976]ETP15943.1 hypothetical protein F441_09407 [Phytophthora nicotianae CJ01A1]ETP43997.1 hypothetical protein F442_09377 [Phytophthora nicotianae P10297]ETL39503.1 hypothetical protein L916_09179 [Phytophthora nicotianae]
MADIYQLSVERPHITLSPGNEIAGFDCLQTPITTFTELLNAAQSVEIDTSAKKGDTNPNPDYPMIQRRLRNRVSCRKTRLKRKLQQHELEVLARERQERHQYLTQLAHKLGVIDDQDGEHSDRKVELFRELAARSLHYALVDHEYSGWVDAGSDQYDVLATTDATQDSEEAVDPPTRRYKRLRRSHDKDVSTSLSSDLSAPQASLFEQWRLVIDGLQNVDLRLYRMDEHDLGAGVYERLCYWKFVGVSSAKVQHEGEIAAVAVTGVTRLRFHQRHVLEININSIRREHNVPFDFGTSLSNNDTTN